MKLIQRGTGPAAAERTTPIRSRSRPDLRTTPSRSRKSGTGSRIAFTESTSAGESAFRPASHLDPDTDRSSHPRRPAGSPSSHSSPRRSLTATSTTSPNPRATSGPCPSSCGRTFRSAPTSRGKRGWSVSSGNTMTSSSCVPTRPRAAAHLFPSSRWTGEQTERDFADMAAAGLNWVRLPFPFWAIETYPGEPFLEHVAWECESTRCTCAVAEPRADSTDHALARWRQMF